MHTLHLIGNAHLDPVWLWRWQEGYAEIKATFRSALDRMEEFPDFTFTCAGASYYQWVEENEPEMFREIQARVAQGRWKLAGGWWLQPDCNLPGGESFARHALYAQRYFFEKFGRIARSGYNVDSFGHNAMLPQLLRLSGMENYVMMRPDEREKHLPCTAFWWQSPDGSRVLTYRIPTAYNLNPEQNLPGKAQAVAAIAAEQGQPQMLFYGVGNHGGGPTILQLRDAEALRAEHGPDALPYSGPDEFFAELRAGGYELPLVADDLQHHASGCYSAVSEVKALNRRAEARLVAAEGLMTLAHHTVGLSYRTDDLRRAWQAVLFHQFHDILGGCSIQPAYDDAREAYGMALRLGAEALNAAAQRISWHIDTACGAAFPTSKDVDWQVWEMAQGGAPVVVFNPLGFPVDTAVQLSCQVRRVEDSHGNTLPTQSVRAARTNGGDRFDTLFHATIPALGYRVFRAFLHKEGDAAPPAGSLEAGDTWLQNDWLRLEVQGDGIRLYDRQSGADVLRSPGAVGVLIDDEASDTWAHGVFSFRQEAGRFGNAQAMLLESGPLRATLRLTTSFGASTLRQDFTLWRHKPGVDVGVLLNFQEHHRMLKLSFPLDADSCACDYEIPYGVLRRANDGREYPGQSWVAIHGMIAAGQRGLALANTAKYSYDALDNDLRVTIARSALFADHYGQRDGLGEFMDQGIQTFRYSLLPFHGEADRPALARLAMELNQEPVVVPETFHRGSLPQEGSFLRVDAANVLPCALKGAEDGDGVVLRCRETAGQAADTSIELPFAGARWQAVFGPWEIKTFRVRQSGAVEETNLLEGELP